MRDNDDSEITMEDLSNSALVGKLAEAAFRNGGNKAALGTGVYPDVCDYEAELKRRLGTGSDATEYCEGYGCGFKEGRNAANLPHGAYWCSQCGKEVPAKEVDTFTRHINCNHSVYPADAPREKESG